MKSAQDRFPGWLIQYMRDNGWKGLNPFQEKACEVFFNTSRNLILSGPTNIGKTEAAYFPILCSANFPLPGVRVLYITSRISLINDQTRRIEALCQSAGIRVTKWHGEAKASGKRSLLKNPSGIVLITLWSLEAMLQCHPENAKALFGNLEYVVIDEFHLFLGNGDGAQLQSLLERLERGVCQKPFRSLAISATIGGDITAVKRFLGDPDNVSVIVDKSTRKADAEFYYFGGATGGEFPEEGLRHLKGDLAGKGTLVFCGSRSRTEMIADGIKSLSSDDAPIECFTHHSHISREERERIEALVKEVPCFAIFNTTMEVGMDIGTVDQVCQIGPAHNVSSITQRVGRSGRRNGKPVIHFYSTRPWDQLKNRAGWSLAEQGIIEGPNTNALWYNVALQQMLSTVRGLVHCDRETAISSVFGRRAFPYCSRQEAEAILDALIAQDVLIEVDGQIAIGKKGERLVGHMDSYSVNDMNKGFSVIADGDHIGWAEYPAAHVGSHLLLKACRWEVTAVDKAKHLIFVKPSEQRKKPASFSDGPVTCEEIENRMKDMLYDDGDPVTEELRMEFNAKGRIGRRGTPVSAGNGMLNLYPFCGTRIYDTLALLFDGVRDGYRLGIPLTWEAFAQKALGILSAPPRPEDLLMDEVRADDYEPSFKYGKELPAELMAKQEASLRLDMEGAVRFLGDLLDGDGWRQVSIPQEIASKGNSPRATRASSPSPGRALCGRVRIVDLFMSESGWNPMKKSKAIKLRDDAERWMEDVAGRWGKSVEFVNDAPLEVKGVPLPATSDNPLWQDDGYCLQFLEMAGLDRPDPGKEGGAEAPAKTVLLLHVDERGRSFALCHSGPVPGYLGLCVIFNGNGLSASGVVAHEILHIFNAWDLYEGPHEQTPQNAKTLLRLYPNEVMINSHFPAGTRLLSPLTAWRVGLTKDKEEWFDSFRPRSSAA